MTLKMLQHCIVTDNELIFKIREKSIQRKWVKNRLQGFALADSMTINEVNPQSIAMYMKVNYNFILYEGNICAYFTLIQNVWILYLFNYKFVHYLAMFPSSECTYKKYCSIRKKETCIAQIKWKYVKIIKVKCFLKTMHKNGFILDGTITTTTTKCS